MCWRHRPSIRIGDQACEQAGIAGLLAQSIFAAVDGEGMLHLIEQCLIHDGFMFAFIYFVLVSDLASIDRILEQLAQCTCPEWDTADLSAVFVGTDLGAISLCRKFIDQLGHRL